MTRLCLPFLLLATRGAVVLACVLKINCELTKYSWYSLDLSLESLLPLERLLSMKENDPCWSLGFDQMSLEHFEGLCLQQGDCSAGSKDVNTSKGQH